MWDLEKRESNLFDGGAHFYNTYETKDNKFISIGSLETKFYNELLEKLEINDMQFNKQMSKDDWPELTLKLSEKFKTKTQAEWNIVFEGSDACYSPVLSLSEAQNHPHIIERNNFINLDGVTQPAPAPRFSETKTSLPKPAPKIGQDNNEILSNLGYNKDEIDNFLNSGTIK